VIALGAIEPEPIVRSLSWAAAELGIAVSTARALAEKGKLPGAFKLGEKLWRVSTVRFRADVETLADIEARARHPAGKGLRAEPRRAELVELPLSITADAPIGGSALNSDSASKDAESIGAVDTVDGVRARRGNRAPIAQSAPASRKRSSDRGKFSPVSTGEHGDNP
jgi:hypothetical protein